MKTKLNALSAWLDRHALLLGAALAAALSMLLALYNVGGGPLGNLNDIGGWRNRALYIALTAAVQLFVLLAAALLYHERFWRLAVRQLLLTVGLVILLMGINHKSYLFVEQMLPFIRRMDAAGLSAMNDMRLNLSAPAVTALYLLTRGPIYDMYMLKLACMGAFLLMAAALVLGAAKLPAHTSQPSAPADTVYVYEGYAAKTDAAFDAASLDRAAYRFRHLYDLYFTGRTVYLAVVPDKAQFTVPPEGYVPAAGAKIMSLAEPTKKMSKSDTNVNSFILMTDDKDAIVRKFKRAVTDSDGVVRFDRETKPGVSNLMCIYSTFTGKSNDEIAAEFEGKGYGDFKLAVAEVTADALAPVQAEYGRILADKAYVDEVLKNGAERASRLANRTVSKVYRKVGLLQLDK